MAKTAVIILAAGQGTRMLSKKQKILHEVGGLPMVAHAVHAAQQICDLPPVLVVGDRSEEIRKLFGGEVDFVIQPEQLGTGHATMMAAPLLENRADQVVVTYGDMPLLRPESMVKLSQRQNEKDAAIVILTVERNGGFSFGRVVRDSGGKVVEIVEVAEAKQRPDGDSILAIKELNAGVYCFNANWLWRNLPHLPLRQARTGQEYYLTDMVGLAVGQDLVVEAIAVDDPDECLGAGTRAELVTVAKAFQRRVNNSWLARGVTLVDPATIFIDTTVEIGRDTVVWPNTFIQGHSMIGEDCVLGPNAVVRDAHVGPGCQIEGAVVENSNLSAGTRVGPFQHVVNDRQN